MSATSSRGKKEERRDSDSEWSEGVREEERRACAPLQSRQERQSSTSSNNTRTVIYKWEFSVKINWLMFFILNVLAYNFKFNFEKLDSVRL